MKFSSFLWAVLITIVIAKLVAGVRIRSRDRPHHRQVLRWRLRGHQRRPRLWRFSKIDCNLVKTMTSSLVDIKSKKWYFLGFYYIIELSYFNLRYHIQIQPVKNINKSFFHWFKIFHIWIICFKTYLNKNTFKMLRVQWVLFKGRHQMLVLWRFLIIKLVKYAGKIPKTTSAANF